MFSQDEIFANLRKHEIQQVSIPEWGEGAFVYIRSLSGTHRQEIEEIIIKGTTKDLRALVFVFSVCDEKGQLMFKRTDMPALNEGNSKVLDKVFHAASKLNKMSEDDIADAKKNS